jgi:hypothetical protein
VGLVWAAAALVAVVVLGYCGYDLAWKSRRLSRDAEGLQALRTDLVALQAQLAEAQRRLPRRTGG